MAEKQPQNQLQENMRGYGKRKEDTYGTKSGETAAKHKRNEFVS